MAEQKILNSLSFEGVIKAFRNYDRGASIEIVTEEGAESVQIARMAWTGGKISLLGYVPVESERPYRIIHLREMDYTVPATGANTLIKSKSPKVE